MEHRDHHKYHDGFDDHLEPLEPLDLNRVHSVDDLVRAMGKTAFDGRRVGEAADVLETMARDEQCFVVGTFSGAMTPAKMGLLICEMIDRELLDAVVSTGALLTHGLVEGFGMTHFKYDPKMDDRQLFTYGYNRIYDTLELEQNLDDLETIVKTVLGDRDRSRPYGSYEITGMIGEHLAKTAPPGARAILKSAHARGIPVYVPELTSSELGLDIGTFNRRQRKTGGEPLRYDAMRDVDHFAELIRQQERVGIFTIGGGVPRNWAQQVAPYLDILAKRVGEGGAFVRYRYGVRICPEPVVWGGLSGSTFSEAVSWGKFVPREEGGKFAEVYTDATVAWPLILKSVIERLEHQPNGDGVRS